MLKMNEIRYASKCCSFYSTSRINQLLERHVIVNLEKKLLHSQKLRVTRAPMPQRSYTEGLEGLA